MAEELPPPMRLMNFVSEEKKTRGERVEDGTAQRDRPLFEIWLPNDIIEFGDWFGTMKMPNGDAVECHEAHDVAKTSLVSYSDESEDDD